LKRLKGMWWRRAADNTSSLLGDRKEICYLSSKVLFWDKWRKKARVPPGSPGEGPLKERRW